MENDLKGTLDALPIRNCDRNQFANCEKLASGKLSHNYGKPPFFMGKSTINGQFQ